MKVQIDKLVFSGKGMAKLNDRAIFVPYSASGDVLEVKIIKSYKDYDEAKILEIIEPSEDRIEAKCPYYGKCGGCQWQHISYEKQLYWKKEIIRETWERLAKVLVDVSDVIPSKKEWHYRNRIQLHVDNWGHVGFKAPNTSRVVDIDECLIADKKINEDFKEKKEQMKYWKKGLSIKVDKERAGRGDFAQVNTLQNIKMKSIVSDLIHELNPKNVLELYAGSGNLTFEIAKSGAHIVASDFDKRAVASGNEYAKDNKIKNVEFEWGSADAILKRENKKFDVILLDPPRTGAKDAMPYIANMDPKNIIYVSCDPATLARDSKVLLNVGYEIKKCQPLDMFPQTYHVETITLFSKN